MISYGFNSERKSEGIMIDDSDDDQVKNATRTTPLDSHTFFQ